MHSKVLNLTLGPLPWSEQTLAGAYWKDFIKARQYVNEHPGFELLQRSESLKAMHIIFQNAAESALSCLADFHAEAIEGNIFKRSRRQELASYETKFRQSLYLFTTSAMTMVEQARTLNNKVELPGYLDRVKSQFAENPKHRFIQELRNDLTHVVLHSPSWAIISPKSEQPSTKYYLKKEQLHRSHEYNREAKAFLKQYPQGIDIGALISEYRADVAAFQSYLQNALDEHSGHIISDYNRCSKYIDSIGFYCFWNLIFSQAIPSSGINPYKYLDSYLTSREMESIQAYPHGSKSQVDRIIEILDEYRSCSNELRSMVYKSFGVDDA